MFRKVVLLRLRTWMDDPGYSMPGNPEDFLLRWIGGWKGGELVG